MTLKTCCCSICSLKGMYFSIKWRTTEEEKVSLLFSPTNTWNPSFWSWSQQCWLALSVVIWELFSTYYICMFALTLPASLPVKINNCQLPSSLPPGTGGFPPSLALPSPELAQDFHCLPYWWYFLAVPHKYGTSRSALRRPTAWKSGT